MVLKVTPNNLCEIGKDCTCFRDDSSANSGYIYGFPSNPRNAISKSAGLGRIWHDRLALYSLLRDQEEMMELVGPVSTPLLIFRVCMTSLSEPPKTARG